MIEKTSRNGVDLYVERPDARVQVGGNCAEQTDGDYAHQYAWSHSTQIGGLRSVQRADGHVRQTAGDDSIQRARLDDSWQEAGWRSYQIARNGSYQKAGIGSVQICDWADQDGIHLASRIVTEVDADKWFFFLNGQWYPTTAPGVMPDVYS